MNRNRRLLRLLTRFIDSIDSGSRYLLYDDFSVDRAAGTIDGTLTDPDGIGGLRNVVDTENKISIDGESLVFSGGKAAPDTFDPNVHWIEPIVREAGRILIASGYSGTEGRYLVGFGFDSSYSGAGLANSMIHRRANPSFYSLDSTYIKSFVSVGDFALVLRASGAMALYRSSSAEDWQLLGISAVGTTTPLYPMVGNYSDIFTIDSVKVSSTLRAPTPIAADTGTVVPVIADAGANGLDGTAENVGLGGPGVGARFDGSGGTIDISALEGNLDPDEFSLVIIASVESSVWTDGTNRRYVTIAADNENRIYIQKSSLSSRIYVYRYGDGTGKFVTQAGFSPTDPTGIGLTVTVSGDSMKVFASGSSIGSEQTGITPWVGSFYDEGCVIGASSLLGSLPAKQAAVSFIATLNGAKFTDAQMEYLTDGTNEITATYLNSAVGAGNYMWLPMDELYTTDGGTLTGIEAGGADIEWHGPTWSNAAGGASNSPTLGAELDSGSLTVGGWYAITASQADYFYTGSAIGDTFNATSATALDANNKVQQIPTADLFRSIADLSSPYVYVSAAWIIAEGTQAGLAICIDDEEDPRNFLLIYHDGASSIYIVECVDGTYTTLGSVSATYSAEATPTARTLPDGDGGTSLWVCYNGAYIGNWTISPVAYASGTIVDGGDTGLDATGYRYERTDGRAYFDGEVGSYVDLYTPAWQSFTSPTEGSFLINVSLSDADWNDGSQNIIVRLRAGSDDYVVLRQYGATAQYQWLYVGSGVKTEFFTGKVNKEGFNVLGLTWSKTGDFMRCYVDGEMVSEQSGLPSFSGNFNSGGCTLFQEGVSGGANAEVWVKDWIMSGEATTDEQMAQGSQLMHDETLTKANLDTAYGVGNYQWLHFDSDGNKAGLFSTHEDNECSAVTIYDSTGHSVPGA